MSQNVLNELRINRDPPPPRRWVGPVLLVLLLLVVGGGAAGWWFGYPKAVRVRTLMVRATKTGGQQTVLNGSGYVVARRAATVSSKVTGKVVEVLVEEGKRVQAGQVLARLDDTNVKASLHLAQAQLDAARSQVSETQARLEEAQLELRRVTALAAQRIATAAELDRAQAEVKAQQARLERQQAEITVAQRQVALWQQQMEDLVIRAPFEGIVVSKDAQPGEMISPVSAGGGFTRTGICTLVDMASLEIEVDVNESYINRVEPGQPVEATLDAYREWKIPAKVIAIIPTADRQKATVKVRVGFDKLDPRLLPQMGVKVAFREVDATGPGQRVILVPKSAVRAHQGQSVTLVVQNGRIERRAVTVSAIREEEVAIATGLNEGDNIIVTGPEDLKDGDRVTEDKP